MKIVGLVGPKRSGKDTAADALVRERGFVKVGFADAVKELALRINPIVAAERYWDEEYQGGTFRLSTYVDTPGGWEFAKTIPEVRRFLQELGTGVRDIDPGFWVKEWRRRACDARQAGAAGVVVPDVRFENEADWLKLGDSLLASALLIRITRPGLDLSDTHVSETEQASIRCDVELINNGTPEQLQATVLTVISREGDKWTSN